MGGDGRKAKDLRNRKVWLVWQGRTIAYHQIEGQPEHEVGQPFDVYNQRDTAVLQIRVLLTHLTRGTVCRYLCPCFPDTTSAVI
jgi:hypothetical protein